MTNLGQSFRSFPAPLLEGAIKIIGAEIYRQLADEVTGIDAISSAALVGLQTLEEGQHPVIVSCRDRIALVIMTAGTPHADAKHCTTGGIEHSVEVVEHRL